MPKAAFPSGLTIVRDLCNAFGPSGYEDDVRAYISGLIAPLVNDLRVDSTGNLIAMRKGRSSKKLMLDAHTDEVGIMVRYIDEHGFLRFAKIGGWDDRVFAGHRVKLRSQNDRFYHGVIGMAPPHVLTDEQKGKAVKAEDYFIDIGAASAEEAAERGAAVGDAGVLDYPFAEMSAQHYVGKALDDRVGCALLILLLKAMAEGKLRTPLTVYANFATSEELGLRGARVAAFGIDPDVAIAVEGTIGSDFPGVAADRCPCSQRKGPVISIADNTIMVPRRMADFMIECAEQAKVAYQIKMPTYGGTDAGAIHLSRAGVLTGVVAVPCRYIHAPNGTLFRPDFEDTLKLLGQVMKRVHTLLE
ncbi:MAG: M20/M25/M40 family metallo-hydrolase [bacterium]|nr:M20/M25/M40 family metallo-hydrolase [bacterium]